jgi:hypothetical protein
VDILGKDRIVDGDGDGVAVVDMGAYEFSGAIVGGNELQVAGCRLQVAPNPTIEISDVRYQIHDVRFVELGVYDLYGKEVRRLVNEVQDAGEYVVRFDGSGLSAGIYLLVLEAGNITETTKLIITK